MLNVKFKNAAQTTLTQAVTPSQTSIVVANADVFPVLSNSNEYYNIIVSSSATVYEIMKVTNKTGNTLTVTRAQESTNAQSFSVGSIVISKLTAGTLTELVNSSSSKQVALVNNTVDLTAGDYFTKTISSAVTFSFTNANISPFVSIFVLDLVNPGSQVITWPNTVSWASSTAPTLTTSGRDILGFISYNGGASWAGYVISKNVG